jgi:hypothetical protein
MSLLDRIANTPLVQMRRLSPGGFLTGFTGFTRFFRLDHPVNPVNPV